MRRLTPQQVNAMALRQLRAALDLQRAELAALEGAEGMLVASIETAADRCDRYTAGSRCSGTVHTKWCRGCSRLVRRCEAHGGLAAAEDALFEHIAKHREPPRAPTQLPKRTSKEG